MNDARYLYLAVDDENDTTCLPDSGAQLGIYFDDEPAEHTMALGRIQSVRVAKETFG